jgi:N-acetylglucosaminyl-diphospho-decaprenol L-rhamnosyltransferase
MVVDGALSIASAESPAKASQCMEATGGRGSYGRAEMMMFDISVVTVLYNSAAVIEGCLRSIPEGVEVIIVDNASTDHGVLCASSIRPDATVVRSKRNVGFGGGCNLGWKEATRCFVAFINPDVRLSPGCLDHLAERLSTEPHGTVGPAMFDSTGAARPCNRRPRVLVDFVNLLPSANRWAPARWGGHLQPLDPVHLHGGCVSHVAGGCFVIRREDLEAVGGFDEDLFLYDEEESLALRLSTLGGRAIYEPQAKVEHIGAHSTRHIGGAATLHFYRSRIVLYRKRDGNLRGILAAALLGGGVAAALPAACINSLLGRRRDHTVNNLWYVVKGIMVGLFCRLHAPVTYRP